MATPTRFVGALRRRWRSGNMVLASVCFVNPSDSLASTTANAHLAPGLFGGLAGWRARCPRARAVDVVAKGAGQFLVMSPPRAWKFFGNLP